MNIIEAVGCFPFLFYFLYSHDRHRTSFHKYIPLIIYLNGMQYHVFFDEYAFARAIDLYTNIVMAAYVNYYTHQQPRAAIGSLSAMSVYLVNQHLKSAIVHVVFVQWFLLYLYSTSPVEDKYKIIL
uniref:Uncharacterized protein n=1 Tax=viral metagenome TaxID=1070528 RepID=A0A6C0F337_9ZZZZ